MDLFLIKKMGKNWLLIISLLFFSCFNNKQVEELISRDQLRNVLFQVQKAQLESYPKNREDTASILSIVLANQNLSQERYIRTILFYTEDPGVMLDILEEVSDSLKL